MDAIVSVRAPMHAAHAMRACVTSAAARRPEFGMERIEISRLERAAAPAAAAVGLLLLLLRTRARTRTRPTPMWRP